MADLNAVPLSNFDTMPSGRSQQRSVASSDNQTVDKGQVAQEVEQKKTDINRLASQEAKGLIKQSDISSLMKDLNVQLEQLQNYLRFEQDEDSDSMVIFIKNSETDEVIRQIPSQEFMTISKNITNYLEMRQQLSETIELPPGLITHQQA